MVKFTKEMKTKIKSTEKVNTKRVITQNAEINDDLPYNNNKMKKSENTAGSLVKSIDNSIFEFFKHLTSDVERTRNQAAIQLVQHIAKSTQRDKQQKEITYTLKRLVRGCGAATNASRAGFYAALVALLNTFNENVAPMQQVFEALQKELAIGKVIQNKEDADAIVGTILVCGAILHSARGKDADSQQLTEITKILVQATRHRNYHTSLAFNFIVELIEMIDEEEFKNSVWELLLPELTIPWAKQTLQTMHCLFALEKRFPTILNKKFCENHFGQTNLINEDNFVHLYKIFWQHNNIDILMHPAFELFGLQLANCGDLKTFWTKIVDEQLKAPTKLIEVVTIKIATDILNNLTSETAETVMALLSENFVKMLVSGLKRTKQKKDESLRAFYNEFLEALVECGKQNMADNQLVVVIKSLIEPPGIFSIEKYTNTRILHQLIAQLRREGLHEVYELYKSRFLEEVSTGSVENASSNMERVQAGYMLQNLLGHKSVQQAHKWRLHQLCFLWNAGTFHLNKNLQVCKIEASDNFSKEFGEQCKNMFYASMQTKMHDLLQEKDLLLQLAAHANEQLNKCKWQQEFLRIRLKDAQVLQVAWKRMFDTVNEKNREKKSTENKLQLVFDILLLHMGLQLFFEPEMSVPAIDDLQKCMQRTTMQMKSKQKAKKNSGEEEEPEWIEVVVDLLLHLLSQNSSTLRNIVNALFPHLCGSLSLNAVHQILSMLEMKDGYNPLSAKGEQEEEEKEELDEEEQEDDSDNESALDNDVEEEEEEVESAEDDEEEEDNDDDDDVDDDEVSPSDILRNAVSQALMANGALPTAQRDDDMDSIDLNDLSEEEGRRLDEALAAAFKAMKRGNNNSDVQAKKSKKYRLQTTTIMHFRIRVLDLLELLLQHGQPQLLTVTEIMLSIFNMLEYCLGNELLQLRTKAEKLLQKLTTLKSCQVDNNLNQENLLSFMRLLVEKRVPAAVFDLINRMRNKCILFLFNQVEKVKETGVQELFTAWEEYVQDYVKSRNPIVNISLWCDMFSKLRWFKVFQLIDVLLQQGVTSQTRIFRRIQVFEILNVFYRNLELQRLKPELFKKTSHKIEQHIVQHLQYLALTKNIKHSPKEFQTLMELLLITKRTTERLKFELTFSILEVGKLVQELRHYVRLESMQVYQQFCQVFKLPVIKNNEVTATKPVTTALSTERKPENGNVPHESENEEESNEMPKAMENGVKRNKRKQETDAKKRKKQKNALRLETASKGLSYGLFSFASDAD